VQTAAFHFAPKEGFDIPVHDWLRGALKSLLLDTITEHAVIKTGLLRWPAVQSLVTDHLERRANWGYHLWGLMVLLLWMKRWNVQGIASSSSMSRRALSLVASTALRA